MTAYRARYVFPVCGPPIVDGCVQVESGRIASVGPFRGDSPGETIDLGNAAILPGLVNAHAHLELSRISRPLGKQGIGMAEWIRLVMAQRRADADNPADAVAAGLAECRWCGVAAVGDIVQPGSPVAADAEADAAGVAVTALLELIGPTSQRAAAAIAMAQAWAGQTLCGSGRKGLSPHAPYSVLPELLVQAVALSASARLPLAMHLAESSEELELLRSDGGPLRNLLDDLGAWSPNLLTIGRRPLDYLQVLSGAHHATIVHGNYLDAEEIAFLAARSDRMSVVYCPRTHAHFGHAPYPLSAMLDAGVNVALGTDSRASVADLNLLSEMRCVAASHPDVPASSILRMATIHAARAIGLEADFGTLEPGKSSHLFFLPLSGRAAADPHHLLWG